MSSGPYRPPFTIHMMECGHVGFEVSDGFSLPFPADHRKQPISSMTQFRLYYYYI